MMKKYKTLRELKDAIDSGELKLQPGEEIVAWQDLTILSVQGPDKLARGSDYSLAEVFSRYGLLELLEESFYIIGIPRG